MAAAQENPDVIIATAEQSEQTATEVTNVPLHEDMTTFWSEVVTVWHNGFMGINVGNIIVAVCIFAVFLVLRGLLSKYILHTLHLWTKRSDTDIDDKIVDAMSPPIRFVPIIMGVFFSTQSLGLDGMLAVFVSNIVRSMIAYTIFWALLRSLGPIRRVSRKLEEVLTKTMMEWIFKFLRVVVIFIGAAVILEIWGIAIGPLLAGLGLFGAAVALGAQDLFKNLIGGITVIAEKRFHPGDWIQVDGVVEGVVEDIGFRSTLVRRFDKAPVYVPNSDLSDAVITNFSRMTNRRIYWKIGVTYSTTHDQLTLIRDELQNYLDTNDDFEKPPKVATFVRIDSFNASSIDFMIYCFTKTTEWGEWLRVKEEFALAIKEIVEEKAGSSFAFPSQSIYIETVPEANDAEIFTPPEKKTPKSDKKPAKKAG